MPLNHLISLPSDLTLPSVQQAKHWWKRQHPHRQDRLAMLAPLVAVLLFFAAIVTAFAYLRTEEFDRALTLVGPHRDDVLFALGDLPVKGYASHGESWSFALALRLASYDLLRAGGDDPVLVLDDVFAELDAGRRSQLAGLVADAEQVLITAAVAEDIPEQLQGRRFCVAAGEVTLVE